MDKSLFPVFIGQINDLADKLETWDAAGGGSGGRGGGSGSSYAALSSMVDGGSSGLGGGSGGGGSGGSDRKTEDKLTKATRDACKITTEVLNGLMTQVEKGLLEFMIAKIGVKI